MELEINTLKDINYGLNKVLSGKVEHLPQAKLVKKMVEDLIECMEFEEEEECSSIQKVKLL